jgi:hypothetical protein
MVRDFDLSLEDIQCYILKSEEEKDNFVLELALKYNTTYASVRFKIYKTLEGSI